MVFVLKPQKSLSNGVPYIVKVRIVVIRRNLLLFTSFYVNFIKRGGGVVVSSPSRAEHAQDLRPPLGARLASPPHVKQRSHSHGVRPQIPDR